MSCEVSYINQYIRANNNMIITETSHVSIMPAWLRHLLGAIPILGVFIILEIYTNINLSPVTVVFADTYTVSDQDLTVSVSVETEIYVAQPFEYKVNVVYNPDTIAPDFRKLLRETRIAPFEQLQFTRPSITETERAGGAKEYTLSYPVLGLEVVPHTEYELHPVSLYYRDLSAGEEHFVTVQPGQIKIIGYYPREIFGIPFQPLKGVISDNKLQKQVAIFIGALFFLIVGGILIFKSFRSRSELTDIEDIREQYHAINKLHSQNNRQSVLALERIFLQLLLRYRANKAYEFWTKKYHDKDPYWKDYITEIKISFQSGYSHKEIDRPSVGTIKKQLDNIFEYIESEIIADKDEKFAEMQGTFIQRIARNKILFASGVASIFVTLVLIILLSNPLIWLDRDIVLYNSWVERIPARMFEQNRDNEAGSADVEMLGNISEQMGVFEKLKSEVHKSRYLYNFGTVVSKAYVATMMGSDTEEGMSMEEEEQGATPSFEYPVLLLTNAARYYPHDENTRRNLELAIMYLENEKKDDSGQQQGETGPPLPGFSRDLTPLLF